MTNQHQTETRESVPANANDAVMGERPNTSNAHTNRSVSNGQPVNVAAATPKAAHATQKKGKEAFEDQQKVCISSPAD